MRELICDAHNMNLSIRSLILPSLASLLLVHGTCAPGNSTDRRALLIFKSQISDDPSGSLTSWNETNATLQFCDWLGVACGSQKHPQRVTSLNLDSFNLTGTISPYLANLSFLRSLELSNNNFHGRIPSELGRLSHLQDLNLSYNSLEGEISISLTTHCSELSYISVRGNSLAGQIPANFSRCRNLDTIFLDENHLTGMIPASIGSLPNLYKFSVLRNHLAGSIPTSIGNATSLAFLDLAENSFEGSIPDNLETLTGLQFLDFRSNNLSGEIPASLFNFSSLYYFNVAYNNLSGELPQDMGNSLPSLKSLEVYYNQLGGPIPISLFNASGLQKVVLQGNMFVGDIPKNLGSLLNLTVFNIASNQLESVKEDLLISLSNCSNLQIVALSRNNLQGIRPSSIANLTTQLTVLAMAQIQISGAIPSGIGKLNKLTVIDMSENALTDTIPSSIGMLQNLNQLYFSANQLQGKIPNSIGNLTQLNQLSLGENELQGKIPSSMGNLMSLVGLDLAHNKLNGSISGQTLSKLSSLSLYLILSNNLLTGPLPSQISSLINLNTIDVSDNRLSGEIPSSFGGCILLEQIFMQGNFFEGTIPTALSGLKGIQTLDLSRNNLSGSIPEFLETLPFLKYLNLSFNDFQGRVPQRGIFNNASATSILGNNKLCGGIHEFHLQPCYPVDAKSSHRSLILQVIIPVGIASVLVISASTACYIWKRRMKANPPLMPSQKQPFPQISFTELHKATDGFSSSNLIGVGSFGTVYKGTMDDDPNRVVAIKVLNLQQRGADKSFMVECDSLRVIRHRNLVNIITVCSSIDRNGDDFKALIFEYMPNGNLDEWLHPKVEENNSNSKNLNLVQKWNIVMDVALALDYLHHQCETPIVHCDLKPSNILLDHDMSARVGDFGLARFLHRDIGSSKDVGSSTGIKGSIGYIAPEYGMGRPVTTKGDVYSYGVILLETFTGKRPTDVMFQSDLNIRKYVEMAYPDRVRDVVDPSNVLNDEETRDSSADRAADRRRRTHEFMISMLKMGLLCSGESRDERMEMGDVIKELLAAKKALDGGDYMPTR